MKSSNKIINLEILRVIGCITIVWFHLCKSVLLKIFPDCHLYTRLGIMSCNGMKAVDLFFILSGFFFAYKLNLHKTLFEFVEHKVKRLWPVLIFVIVTSYIIHIFGGIDWNLWDNLLILLGLNGTSLVLPAKTHTVAGPFWYVSAMLWVLSFIFYIRKILPKKFTDLIIAMCVFFSYSFILHSKQGAINSMHQTFYYIFNVGLMRAMGGCGIGYFIGEWFKNWNNNEHPNKLSVYIYSIVEFACLYFIINDLMFYKNNYQNQIIFIIVFVLCIVLFLQKRGFVSQFLNNSKFAILVSKAGVYTYSIYMTHFFVIKMFTKSFYLWYRDWILLHPVLMLIFTMFVILMFGILTYYLVEKPVANYFRYKKALEKV